MFKELVIISIVLLMLSLNGHAGSVQNATVFVNSPICKMLKNGTIPPCPKSLLKMNQSFPFVCYVIPPIHLTHSCVDMKDYELGGTEAEQYFGFKHSSARMVIECAYGRFKARWGCLKGVLDVDLEFVPTLIYACFILHNYCELNHQNLDNSTVEAALHYDEEFTQSGVESIEEFNAQPANRLQQVEPCPKEAKGIRDNFKMFFE